MIYPLKKTPYSKRKFLLFPLMDMFFILLMFFLVTQLKELKEGSLPFKVIETPKDEERPGKAHALIQIIDENGYCWYDTSSIRLIRYGQDIQPIDYERLKTKIIGINNWLKKNPNSQYRILVRCPNHLPYILVKRITTNIKKEEDLILWSILGGSRETLDFQIGVEDNQPFLEIRFLGDGE